MNKSKQIESLWEQFQAAIDAAYKDVNKNGINSNDPRHCLRSYASNVGWHDEMQLLIDTETTEERKHRKARPYATGDKFFVSAVNAAKLLLMNGAADAVSEDAKNGSLASLPPAPFRWLTIRRTIAEAELLGWIVRDYLTKEWMDQVKAIDYTTLHN